MHNFFTRIPKKLWLTCIKPALVSALIILSLTACGETKDAATLISEAVDYQKKGNDNAAIIQLRNALQQEPNNVKARFLLGSLYQQNHNPLSAEKELNRALDLGMDTGTVLPVLSQVLFDLGKFQQLLDTTEQHTENGSDEVQLLRAKALLAVHKAEEAKIIFDQLLAKKPDHPEALTGLAQYALLQNDLVLATEYSDQAIAKNPQNLSAWVFKANMLRAQGKSEQALTAFEQVVELAPDDANAYSNKADLEIALGKYDAAKNSIARVREIAPDSLILNHSQALLDFNQGRYAEALTSIQTLLGAAPEHLPSVLLAGAIQFSLGSFTQAEQYLEQYLKNIPGNIYARKLMISTLLSGRKTKQAMDVLEPTLTAVQHDPQLFALAGEVYMQSGDFTKATEFYEKANELAPNNAALHTALGMSKLALGDRALAVAELELAADLDKSSPRAGVLLALTHINANEFGKALSTIEDLEKADPQNPLFHNLKGGVYIGQKDFDKARASFNKALTLQPDFFPAISNLARLDLQDQKPGVAKKRFEDILKNDDRNIQAMNALAGLALSQGKPDEATKWLELSSNKNPNAVDPAIRLATHYARQGDKEKALLLSRKLYGMHPNEPRVIELLGQVQLAHNNHAAALDSYEKLAAELPDSAAAQLKIAEIHSIMKDYPATSAALRKALFINPDYVEAKVAMARLANIENKENEAIAIAQKIQKEHAGSPIGYELEGDLLMHQQKFEMAAKAYEKAFSISQTTPLTIKIYTALNQAGSDNKAHAHITQWLSNNPDDATTRLLLANDHLSKKQYAHATKEYEVILEKNPQHLITLNNLAWLYQQNKNPRALEFAEKAYKIAPEASAIQDTLGWILAENGEIDRALPLLEKAAASQSENATIQYHYAYALTKAGNQTRARQILGELSTSDKKFPEAKEAQELLKQLQQ
ncbi:XrtA/PEP-CTERM system TPR-repeat protein PrsT [Nitrosomonas aestuarii]|uniref:XrtA/PEP-CTERM system TPR-repeat protein PrsT n=1 Tax=Nitrosomonas aestuarii TaxID=52441 RepID=UPI000D320F4D|nr:XrtA/PEP-CTERM system TPR-repeat protein PrsT [Nitrosomonas aestuarii]PTN12056.1 putative PEP-CTERM system TPR-repeat lipoprotein [Nitrosomonas aestuarii]